MGWHLPWINRLFSKSMRGKILNFLLERIIPLYQLQKTIKKIDLKKSKEKGFCMVTVSLISCEYNFFYDFSWKKNFKRGFLKTTSLMLRWSFLRKYWTGPYEILYTYSAHVWLLLFTGKSLKKRLFSKKNVRQPPFCYFCIEINNSRSYSSHTHTELKSFWFFCFRWFFSEKTPTQQPCLFFLRI